MQTMELVTQLIERWNSHDAEGIVQLCAPNFTGCDVSLARQLDGLDHVRAGLERYFLAFPDLCLTADDIIVEREKAVLVWTMQGRHSGPFMNIPATNRTVELHGVTTMYAHEGKLVRGLQMWDVAGFLREIGLLPELAA